MKINFINNNQISKNLLQILFYIYPIIMLKQSGYVTTYVSLFTIFSLLYLFLNQIKIKFFLSDFLILLFFLVSIFSTFINLNKIDNLIIFKSISDLRFFLLYLVIKNLFYHNIIKIKPIAFICFVCCLFLSIDIYIQHIFGQDLFGYPPIDSRYNGIFYDEAIAGSYIQKFSLLSILAIFFFKINNNFKKILIILTGSTMALGTLLSLDRMPFVIIFFGFILLILYIKKLRVIFLLNILIIIIIFAFFFLNYKPINKRYFDLNKELNVSKIINLISNKKENNNSEYNFKNVDKKKESILSGGYLHIYRTTLYIYKYDWLIGTGTKSFQNKCYKLSDIKEDLSCPPHPHNIYLEILINTGLIGLLIFLLFIINIIFNLVQSEHRKDEIKKITSNLFIIMLLCELIPLRSYGSIFQTVNGSMFWFLLSIIGSFSLINRKQKSD